MIQRWGEKEAVRRTVATLTMSSGLELLAKYGRLDCAYEQIILDFPDEFDGKLIVKARGRTWPVCQKARSPWVDTTRRPPGRGPWRAISRGSGC
jgi:hypothetical protein